MAGLGWIMFLSNALLIVSMASYASHSGGKPVASICETVLSMRWPVNLLPFISFIILIASFFHPKPKEWINHHLFIPSLITVVFIAVFTFCFAAIWPWIPPVISKFPE